MLFRSATLPSRFYADDGQPAEHDGKILVSDGYNGLYVYIPSLDVWADTVVPFPEGGTGDWFLAVLDGGLVTLCGEWRAGRSTLAASVEPGAREIVLTHLTDWQPGDHIVIGLTDTPAHLAEGRIVAAVDGSVLRLDAPLRYPHWGGLPAWPGALVEGRAEVGLLTRNVRVTGAGGYLLVMPDGRLHLENVELTGLGHREHPPIHLDPASGPDALRMVGSSLHHNQRPAAALFEGHPHRRHQNVIYDHA